MHYKIDKLKNGITLLKVPIKDAESVTVNFFVRTGSRNETPRLRGVSHFLEHLLFKGTKKFPNAKILSSTVESIGADYNAFTNKEFTVYYIKAAANFLPLIFDVLSEMLLRPKLDATEIEREKGVIIEEMRMYRDTPMRSIHDSLEQQMWPNSDLGDLIIGDEQTITKMSRQDIKGYLASQYVNENLILAVAGKYDEEQLHYLVKKHLSSGKNGEPSAFTPAPQDNGKSLIKIEYKKTEQAHLAVGFYGYDFNHPDVYIVQVLANILGGGMSSRLFSEIRERRGLAYYVRMASDHYQDAGSVVVSAGLRLGKLEQALTVLAQQLRQIKSSKVGAVELTKAKRNLKGRVTLSLEDAESRLEWFLIQTAFYKKIVTPDEVFRKIYHVTPLQIQRVARELLQKDRFKAVLIGPYKGLEEKFKKLLKF